MHHPQYHLYYKTTYPDFSSKGNCPNLHIVVSVKRKILVYTRQYVNTSGTQFWFEWIYDNADIWLWGLWSFFNSPKRRWCSLPASEISGSRDRFSDFRNFILVRIGYWKLATANFWRNEVFIHKKIMRESIFNETLRPILFGCQTSFHFVIVSYIDT